MFVGLFAVASLITLVVAGPTPLIVRDGQCNTGSAKCCNSVKQASDPNTISALQALGLVNAIADVTGDVGFGCSPIVGTGAQCQQKPVCCEDNHFNGLVSVGCSPINANA